MKILPVYFKLQILVTLVLLFNYAEGQIVITSGAEVTPVDMVETILEEGIIYDNVTFTGADTARGIFTNGSSTNLGLDVGIFLTTGSGYNIPGPNNFATASANNGMPGNAILNSITTGTTYDASVLEFDFIPETDTIRIKYVFGSEEYNEYVGSAYNDVFGLFITGPNPMGGQYSNKNIAIVPGTANTSVKINSVNNGYSLPGVVPTVPCMNCAYYDDNTNGLTLEYDGFTVVLVAWLLVVPCEEYHAMIGIADVSSYDNDSGVFIKELSIKRPKIDVETILNPPGLTEDMVEGHVEADVVFRLPNPEYAPITVCYEIGGTAINGIDYEEIENCITFEEGEDSVSFHIVPLYDGIIEGEETIRLIIENTLGCIVRYDTVEFTIRDYLEMLSTTSPNTIICEGYEVTLWVEVMNGYPPYSYSWEPGGFTTDSIAVTPDTTTTYVVTYYDLFQESGMDSVKVTVFPVTEFSSFGFEAALNPGLPFDVTGEFEGDTIRLHLPGGTNLQNLVASYTFTGEYIYVTANGVPQEPGVTPNDFTDPLIYVIISPGGCPTDWIVIADIETGITEEIVDGITLFPNPTDGKFYLETTKPSNDPIKLRVMDLTGRIVYERKQAMPETIEIDLSGQLKGMYFLRVKFGEKEINRKLIIQ
jgi:hypothetical protein